MPQFLSLSVTDIVHETLDAVTVHLQSVNSERIPYIAGQFLTLVLKIRGREVRRSFSLSSSPGIDRGLAITVKRIPNGEVSNYVYHHLKANDIVEALPPSGRFVLPITSEKRDVFMIAAGSGITPIFSVLKDVLHNDPLSKVVLVYSNRDESSTIFFRQLNDLSGKYAERFKCIYIFSSPKSKAYQYKGHLSMELLNQLIDESLEYEKAKAEFMVCGPLDYMRKAEMIIVSKGFNKTHVHKENFVVIAEQEAINTPPHQHDGDKMVSMNYSGETFSLVVPKGKPILKAALEKGIYLPYSCQGGICGTCSAICTHGDIKMSINDVLTEKELEQGWVLTCVGYPVTESASIMYP